MTFDSAAVLGQLLELQQQIIDTPRFTDSLQMCEGREAGAIPSAAPGIDVPSTNMRIAAVLSAERHMTAMAVNTGRLRERVVPSDGLGDDLQSLSELMLRTARMIVLTELEALRDVLGRATHELRARTLCWGAFEDVDDLSRRVRARLQQITNTWTAVRCIAATDRPAYRTALRAAHAGMRHLGSASAFGAFVREARTRSEWPALQVRCARMGDALVLRIDIDADVPLIVHRGPLAERAVEQAS